MLIEDRDYGFFWKVCARNLLHLSDRFYCIHVNGDYPFFISEIISERFLLSPVQGGFPVSISTMRQPTDHMSEASVWGPPFKI